ncbi:MAG: glycine/sarcosine/betaine reductase selenoprotein B family protein [Alicyclobacillaceae bacterium]|jgi:D-proline reductase (dithiol) PrdB|uniref:glycine/sarcosine/betaine reductase selenoprotein B family protein n=1 Tax=Alicyclobacillus sp. SP_1 TaxID=2942475 RepID=UPI00215753E9|nr:glycine/sarcosine/betaine reductase selenoprotein B family protein [Alicyclobacillus sp. SP_1]MCY0888496.1 glycine/sarcosine/betaine reductase selenoprotein B family protein [Alicyclobacillaceae bacterium]
MSLSLSRKTIPYTPVTRPLSETTLMVVSTAGAHLTTQEPFNTAGDASYRVIPGDAHSSDFTVTHGAPKEHYNTDEPKRDINTIFPIDRLRELVETGFLGGLAEKHLTMMGYAMRLNQINQETVPAIANEVEKSRADAVLLTAG